MMPTIRPIAAAVVMFCTSAAIAQPSEPAAGSPMASMHQTMQEIRETEDPERRAELLEAHLNEMHAIMERMHGDMAVLMRGMQEQQRETKRLHDHRKMK